MSKDVVAFVIGIHDVKIGPSVPIAPPTEEREMTGTRQRNKINNNSCARQG